MKTRFLLLLGLSIALATAPVVAQCNGVCDPGLGTAQLLINLTVPSQADPVFHRVEVGDVFWQLDVLDPNNVGAGFILLASASPIVGNAFPVPWGGSIDLVAPGIVLDGIAFSQSAFDFLAVMPFAALLPLPGALCSPGLAPSVQAITQDASNPPFFLRNTQAGQAVRNTVTTLFAVGDDVSFNYPVVCLTGITFNGTVYPAANIGSNGIVSFVTGSGDFSPTVAEMANGFRPATGTGTPLAANPGVAVMWGDYARGTVTNDFIAVVEDFTTNSFTVTYANQEHWSSQTPAGTFGVTFDNAADSVSFDLSGYIPAAAADGVRLLGVTDGTDRPAPDIVTVGPLASLPGFPGYVTPVGPETIIESVAPGASPSVATPTFSHATATPNDFNWVVF